MMCISVTKNKIEMLRNCTHCKVIVGWLCIISVLSEACTGLELRQIQKNSIAKTGIVIPNDSMQVFVYAGKPRGIKVTDNNIAVDYGRCGIIFNRDNGGIIERFDIADGWPEIRPESFPKADSSYTDGRFIGPGIFDKMQRRRSKKKELKFEETCSVKFEGLTWRAYQPADFLRTIQKEGYDNRNGPYSTWSGILARLNEESYLQADAPGQKSKRYKMSNGLASNIVTRLISSQRFLWAICADIYVPKRNRWGAGGLSRFDPKTNQWEHIKTIEGHSVRWVTLMETIGDELWIGFREGNEVEGDKINYGMGIFVDIYRPKTSAILLARFANVKWTVYPKPLPLIKGTLRDPNESPTEMPLQLAGLSGNVFLFSGYRPSRPSLNFEYELDGCISSLNIHTGKWSSFDLYKDFDADRLIDMSGEKGEILVTSNRGVHRWDDKSQSWKFLDPQTQLKNPSLSSAAHRGNELWIGYTNQSFGVLGQQGISVFNEETLKWSYISPEQIGTSCPVRRMGIMPNNDVWVLFAKRRHGGPAMEFPYYPREAEIFREFGLGCFRNNKWEFPIELHESVDATSRYITGPGRDMVAIGDKLFVADREGVYLGPEHWRRIIEGDILRIEPSSDKQSLIILLQGPRKDQASSTFQRGRYDLATCEISFEALPFEGLNMMQLNPPSYLWERDNIVPEKNKARRGDWVLIPGWKEGTWVAGPLGGNGHHGVIETQNAYWIISRGELVRLDLTGIEN